MTTKAFYTPEELRDVLPLGRSQIYKMLADGHIPSLRLGKKFVIPRAAFDAWLASCGTINPIPRT